MFDAGLVTNLALFHYDKLPSSEDNRYGGSTGINLHITVFHPKIVYRTGICFILVTCIAVVMIFMIVKIHTFRV